MSEVLQYRSFSEFWNDIGPDGHLFNKIGKYIYRGQANDWPLIPTLYREDHQAKIQQYKGRLPTYWINGNNNNIETIRIIEYSIIQEFYDCSNKLGLNLPKCNLLMKNAICNNKSFDLLWNDYDFDEVAEIAALAQHYGVPTRLIDWSVDIYVSLFFASYGAVEYFFKTKKYYSDNIVIWMLPIGLKKLEKDDCVRENMGIKEFINFIIPDYCDNNNLCAQKGVLTYWDVKGDNSQSVDTIPLNEKIESVISSIDAEKMQGSEDYTLYKLLIPSIECPTIIKQLFKLGYTPSRIFPSYMGITQEMEFRNRFYKCFGVNNIETENIAYNQERNNLNNKKHKCEITESDNAIIIRCSMNKVSAGCGYDVNDPLWYDLKIERTPEAEKADFCVEIEGNSMLPKYSNGDFVLVKKGADILEGNDCIYVINGKGYLKRFCNGKLKSLNPKYKDVIPSAYDDSSIYPIGKVIGKAKVLSRVR